MEILIVVCLVFIWLVLFGGDLIALIILVIFYFSFIEGNFDNEVVPLVKQGNIEIITVAPTAQQLEEETITYRRKESCPHVPLEFGIVWIEYNGELVCTQGEKK